MLTSSHAGGTFPHMHSLLPVKKKITKRLMSTRKYYELLTTSYLRRSVFKAYLAGFLNSQL